jgi:4-hydroxybenzoate polyprenyltransferase
MPLASPRKLSKKERLAFAGLGIAFVAAALLLAYFEGHGFGLIAIVLILVGLMWLVWAVLGRTY